VGELLTGHLNALCHARCRKGIIRAYDVDVMCRIACRRCQQPTDAPPAPPPGLQSAPGRPFPRQTGPEAAGRGGAELPRALLAGRAPLTSAAWRLEVVVILVEAISTSSLAICAVTLRCTASIQSLAGSRHPQRPAQEGGLVNMRRAQSRSRWRALTARTATQPLILSAIARDIFAAITLAVLTFSLTSCAFRNEATKLRMAHRTCVDCTK
jgi:hypothetical protein